MSNQHRHQPSASAIGVRELRAALATYLDRVQTGATVVINRGGRPVARLVPLSEPMAAEVGMEEMARLGLIDQPRAVAGGSSLAGDAGRSIRPLPVDVRVDRIIRQVRG